MKYNLLSLYTILLVMMIRETVAVNGQEDTQSHLSSTYILRELQNTFNVLASSRVMTLIVDHFQSFSTVPDPKIKPQPDRDLSTFWQVFYLELMVGIKRKAYCAACNIGINFLKVFANIDGNEQFIGAVYVEFCFRVALYPLEFCEGVSNMTMAMAMYSIKHTIYNASTVCAALVGFGCLGQVEDRWTVKLPEKPKPPITTPKQPKKGASTLTILHLTDPHIDLKYSEGTPADCGLHVCCRKDSPESLSGVTAGPWGAYGDCDIPLKTLISMLDHINNTIKPDIVLFTGDVPPHDGWLETRNDILYLLDMTGDLLKKYFPENVFFAVGNHETAFIDSFPPDIVIGDSSADWLYKKLVSVWGQWLPESTFTTIRKGGFYSAPARKGLRIISINVDYGFSFNIWLLLNATDPMGQLQWLIDELETAEDIGEKTWIVMKVLKWEVHSSAELALSPWRNFIFPNRWKRYREGARGTYRFGTLDTTFNNAGYESTIVGITGGHIHYDLFQILYEESHATKRPTNVVYVTPSITAVTNLNLAYRTFTLDGDYDGSTFEILDHTTYYANLETGNRNNEYLEWKKLYSAKEFYDLESLQPSEWHKLIKRMKTDQVLFDRFYSMYSQNNSAFPSCDAHCKEVMLCALKQGRGQDLNLCNV